MKKAERQESGSEQEVREEEEMRITRITLRNWRNFKSVDVELQKRVFLAGPNASGKSNFLDALRFLKDIATVGGGLGKAVELRGGISKVRSLYARRKPDIFIGVELSDLPNGNTGCYSLEFNQNNNRIPVVKKEHASIDGVTVLERDSKTEADDPEKLTQTNLEQVAANKNFRQIADSFKAIRYLHIVPQLVREPDRSTGKNNDPFGGDFLEQLAGFQNDKSSYFDKRMRKINQALQVAVPHLKELTLIRDFKGVPHLQGVFEHWRPGAGRQQENDFSDGTLRLFGLLWSILDAQGPLLLEEPELSLHPSLIRHIPQIFAKAVKSKKSGAQIIVSTHSTDIFSDPATGANEVLLFSPTDDGTIVSAAGSIKHIRNLLESGLDISDIIVANTEPKMSSQLSLFGTD